MGRILAWAQAAIVAAFNHLHQHTPVLGILFLAYLGAAWLTLRAGLDGVPVALEAAVRGGPPAELPLAWAGPTFVLDLGLVAAAFVAMARWTPEGVRPWREAAVLLRSARLWSLALAIAALGTAWAFLLLRWAAAGQVGPVVLALVASVPLLLYAAFRWALAPVVVLLEGVGPREGLRRSARLMRGAGWATVLALLVAALPAIPVEWFTGLLAKALDGVGPRAALWLSAALVALAAWWSTLTASYLMVRVHRDQAVGPPAEAPSGAATPT